MCLAYFLLTSLCVAIVLVCSGVMYGCPVLLDICMFHALRNVSKVLSAVAVPAALSLYGSREGEIKLYLILNFLLMLFNNSSY